MRYESFQAICRRRSNLVALSLINRQLDVSKKIIDQLARRCRRLSDLTFSVGSCEKLKGSVLDSNDCVSLVTGLANNHRSGLERLRMEATLHPMMQMCHLEKNCHG